MTKHELRNELLKSGLQLNTFADCRIFITKGKAVCAIIFNDKSIYKMMENVTGMNQALYQQLETLISQYCQTSSLERDNEREFVLRERGLPQFPLLGGYGFLGVSDFDEDKYVHVSKEKAKVFTFKELEELQVDYEQLKNKYDLIPVY